MEGCSGSPLGAVILCSQIVVVGRSPPSCMFAHNTTHNLCIIYVQYKSITGVDSHLGNWGLGKQVNGRSFPSPFQPAKQEKHTRRARSMAMDKEEQIIRSLVWEGGGEGGIKGQVRNKVVVSLCSKFLTFEKNFI